MRNSFIGSISLTTAVARYAAIRPSQPNSVATAKYVQKFGAPVRRSLLVVKRGKSKSARNRERSSTFEMKKEFKDVGGILSALQTATCCGGKNGYTDAAQNTACRFGRGRQRRGDATLRNTVKPAGAISG